MSNTIRVIKQVDATVRIVAVGPQGPAGTGSSPLDALTDVTISSPVTNQLLQYNGSQWVNATVSFASNLDGLTDVTISSPGTGQTLRYNGTQWVNAAPQWSDLTGVPSTFTPSVHNQAWSTITSTPTTIAGYGITDPIVLTSGSYANPTWITSLAWAKLTGVPSTFTPSAHNQAWSTITSTPTTLSGYGITDPVLLSNGSYFNPVWLSSVSFDIVGDRPTTLAGYGIVDPVVLTSGSYSNPSWITSLAWSKLTSVPSTFPPSAHGHSTSDLTDVTTVGLDMLLADTQAAGRAAINAQIAGSYASSSHTHPWSDITGKPTTISGYGITDGVTSSRQIVSGTGLSGGGNLSTDRTLSVSFGTSSNTACVGDDARLSNSRPFVGRGRNFRLHQAIGGAGVTTRASFGSSGFTPTGTVTQASDADGIWQTWASAATNLAQAVGLTPANIQTRHRPDCEFKIKTGSNVSSCMYQVGLVSASLGSTASPTSIHCILLQYDTVSDSTWKVWTCDGSGSGTSTSTSVSLSADTVYVIRIVFTSSSTALVYVNDTLAATVTSSLPGSSTWLSMTANLVTREAVSKTIYWSSFLCESN